VVVAGGEGVEAIEGVDGDRIFRSVVTHSSSKAADNALSNVVSGLTTEVEAVTAENSIRSDGGALNGMLKK
jgi:hypothetical protein